MKKKINKEHKKDRSQHVLLFKTCDSSHEPETNFIESKL